MCICRHLSPFSLISTISPGAEDYSSILADVSMCKCQGLQKGAYA